MGMSIRAEHELHTRRRGRNLGIGLMLGGFVLLVMALTYVKITNIDFNNLPGGAIQTQEAK
jgi:hypothetical protein